MRRVYYKKWHCHDCNNRIIFIVDKDYEAIPRVADFIEKHAGHHVFENFLVIEEYGPVRYELSNLERKFMKVPRGEKAG